MVKQIGQVLIIKWKNGKVTKKHQRGMAYSDWIDQREEYNSNPKVMDTELQYDL